MMPIDTRVIRYTPDTDDRAAARALLMALIAAETANDDVLASGGDGAPLVLTRGVNKLLQNALSVMVRNRPVSIVVLDDEELLDTGTVAEILGFGAVWVSKMIDKGHIEAHQHRAGRKHLITGKAVVDRIDADPQRHSKHVAATLGKPDRRRGRH